MDAVDAELRAIHGVQSAHYPHRWSLDGNHQVLTTHLVVNADVPKADIVAVKDRDRMIALVEKSGRSRAH